MCPAPAASNCGYCVLEQVEQSPFRADRIIFRREAMLIVSFAVRNTPLQQQTEDEKPTTQLGVCAEAARVGHAQFTVVPGKLRIRIQNGFCICSLILQSMILMSCRLGRRGIGALIIIVLIVAAVIFPASHIFKAHSPSVVSSKTSLSLHHSAPVSCPQHKTVLRTRFPDALIIGVRKGGTRALIDFLATHPKVVKARGEAHFFDKEENLRRGINYYLSLLPPVPDGSILVEKTPAYFVTPTAPRTIRFFHPAVKLILIVRDPVDRLVSSYAQLREKHMQMGKSYQDLPDVLYSADGSVQLSNSMVQGSMYSRHLQNWLKVFPREQIYIVDGDSFVKDPHNALKGVEKFLQLESYFTDDSFTYNATKGFYCVQVDGEVECLGSGKGREHPKVEERVIADLRKVFTPYNEEFEKLSGQTFGWNA